MKNVSAVIVAAGTASRMRGIDKTVAPIGGVPMILRTVRALAASERITEILVVTREDLVASITELCKGEEKFKKALLGGASRAESVVQGLQDASGDLVAIHDGARPFVTPEIIDRTVKAAESIGAAAPAIAVRDTIKVAKNSEICATPDRSTLFAVQTPQIFDLETIKSALQTAMTQNIPLTDDCSAAEAAGLRVVLTEGSDENIKITTPMDLIFAEAILKRREAL